MADERLVASEHQPDVDVGPFAVDDKYRVRVESAEVRL